MGVAGEGHDGLRRALVPLLAAALVLAGLLVLAARDAPASESRNARLTSGPWSQTGALRDARLFGHTATLLKSGKVLVAGGGGATTAPLASAELYDPKTGTWTPTGSMKVARMDHTATLLDDGRVLVTGGSAGQGFPNLLTSVEIYNPTAGTWSDGLPLSVGRSAHTETLLRGSPAECGANCGKVLVIGGDGPFLAHADLFDPLTNTWSVTRPLANDRSGHRATLLSGSITQCADNCGKVLVVGGEPDTFASQRRHTPELYDPKSNSWALTGNEGVRRITTHSTTLLANGKVLVAGGNQIGLSSPNVLDSAELFDPSQGIGAFASTALLPAPRFGHAAVRLASGEVLVAGGRNASSEALASAVLYEPTAGTWSAADPMLEPRAKPSSFGAYSTDLPLSQNGPSATLLSGDAAVCGDNCGKVLVVGGSNQRTAELFGPSPAGGGPGGPSPAEGGPGGGGGSGGDGSGGGGAGASPGDGGIRSVPGIPAPVPGSPTNEALTAEQRRAGELRACVARTRRLKKSARRRARRRCLKQHRRRPGRVTGFKAAPAGKREIALTFLAPGTDGNNPPAATSYVVKQSTSPIKGASGFRRAQTLCGRACRFNVTDVGATVTLTVTDLRPHTTYHYAIAARDNVSNNLGPRTTGPKDKAG